MTIPESNSIYTATTLLKEEISENHKSVFSSFGFSLNGEEYDFPSLYWILKLHRSKYKQRYIAEPQRVPQKTSFYAINFYSYSCQNGPL